MWYRVFCRAALDPTPESLLTNLHSCGLTLEARFKGDDLGWSVAEFILGTGTPIFVERYLTADDEIRDDLNTWAAYLETLDYSANNVRLMEHVIQTQQLVTVRKPLDHSNESAVEHICVTLCQVLAGAGDGIYQVEGDGWYSANGELLLKHY